MASSIAGLVTVEEYLRTGYKPACDFIDGTLRQKPMPTWKYGLIQAHLGALLNAHRGYLAASELTQPSQLTPISGKD